MMYGITNHARRAVLGSASVPFRSKQPPPCSAAVQCIDWPTKHDIISPAGHDTESRAMLQMIARIRESVSSVHDSRVFAEMD